ncbi:MAG: DUF4230 domain-containing protein [Chloroflexi bacterium]|nr:MAG: DUF4230 domain-containing protein [Chloroflexota bacterium]
MIIFLVLGSLATYLFIRTMNATDDAIIEPIGELVRQLVVPATPVILPDSKVIVNEITNLARLETASVELEETLTAERNSEFLWGLLGETMIFEATGIVYAGIDFAEMGPDDLVVVDPDTVMVHLPEAKIFDDIPALDNEKSRVLDRDTGLLTRADPELETQIRIAAEQQIREEALATDVLKRANENAQITIEQLLFGLGFENVIFKSEPPPEPAPFVQEVPKGQLLATPTPES